MECGLGLLNKPPAAVAETYKCDYFNDKKTEDYYKDSLKKFAYVKPYLNLESRILDFGCAVGHFAGVCKNKGYSVAGFDISEYAASQTATSYDIETKSGALNKDLFAENYFDVITCFDVIEHIPNYIETLKIIKTWLKPGGHIFITTPDTESWDAKILGKYWYGFTKIPQHILYFNRNSLQRILTETGFTNIKINQWGFVRSLGFWFKKSFPPYFYIPMVDMIVVAKK
ncbi:MAG: class I SAM-dependent methyltransferase [candidate division WWE3 bacterium]|nr:class I SAM-dependent methyltransferase [candidate division WWE3 bacterium]